MQRCFRYFFPFSGWLNIFLACTSFGYFVISLKRPLEALHYEDDFSKMTNHWFLKLKLLLKLKNCVSAVTWNGPQPWLA